MTNDHPTPLGLVDEVDTLTGLPNRISFLAQLEMAQIDVLRSGKQFAVLFLNLDDFRPVNESLGHKIGDQLLIEMSRRLRCALRPQDIVARFGADEFTILAKDVSHLSDVESIVQRVQGRLGTTYDLGGEQLTFSASIGVAIGSVNQNEPEEILRNASIALHKAKSLGKSRHQIFDVSMHQHALLRLGLEGDLRRAVDRQEFELYYQPFIALQSEKIVGFEGLVRWNRPGHGVVGPQDFISVAERNGLILPIGRWVLREGCRQISKWTEQFPNIDLKIAINVSSQQISQSDLIGEVNKALGDFQLDAAQLELEVTESGIIENPVAAADVMITLHQLGVGLSIDDFGTGYSSLSQLYRLPFDILKIDRLFINKLCDPDDSSLVFVETIVRLAKDLGMTVVAEGIETEEQLRRLREMGCDIGQGFFFSQPVTHDQAADLLQRSCAATAN